MIKWRLIENEWKSILIFFDSFISEIFQSIKWTAAGWMLWNMHGKFQNKSISSRWGCRSIIGLFYKFDWIVTQMRSHWQSSQVIYNVYIDLFIYYSRHPHPTVCSCRVAEKEPVNKMSLHNLATVFGPTLLRPSESESTKGQHITSASDIWSHDVMAQVHTVAACWSVTECHHVVSVCETQNTFTPHSHRVACINIMNRNSSVNDDADVHVFSAACASFRFKYHSGIAKWWKECFSFY